MIDRDRTINEFGYDPDELSKWSKKKICVICDDCGKERIIIFQQYRSLCLSCSKIGKRNHNYKKIFSDETKQKIGEKSRGRIHSEESKIKMSLSHSGKNNHFYGKKRSEETKQKIRKKLIGRKLSEECKNKMKGKRPAFSGKNNPNWNSNLTDEERMIKRNYPEYKEWRKLVYERDNYQCQICGDKRGGNLNAHHIESYANNSDKRILLENGITMCEECHKNFHHLYGNNNTKVQFIEFISNLRGSK